MPLIINEMKTSENEVELVFEIGDDLNDVVMLQEIFASLVSNNFSIECSFGYKVEDNSLKRVVEFKYIIDRIGILRYNYDLKEISYLTPKMGYQKDIETII